MPMIRSLCTPRFFGQAGLICGIVLTLLTVPAWAGVADKQVADHKVTKAQAGQVKVEDAWIRPAVEGQMATGGFMSLTAPKNLTLVGFVSPVARSSELHEMAMEGDVMRMRAVPSIELPAGKTVSLQTGPGHQHLMLMDLRQPLKEGDEVRVTLKLRTPDGRALTQTIKVPVKNGQMMKGMGGEAHTH